MSTIDPANKIYKSSKKYNRIGSKKKKILLEKVFFENKKIKTVIILKFAHHLPFFLQAAEELGINYSTAKTIFHIHRKKFKKEFTTNNAVDKYAGYKLCQPKQDNQIEVCVTQGGRPLNKTNKNPKTNNFGLNEILDTFLFLIDAIKQEQNRNEVLSEGLKKIWFFLIKYFFLINCFFFYSLKEAIVIKPINEEFN